MAINNLQELVAALSSDAVNTSRVTRTQNTSSLRVNPQAQNLTNINTLVSTVDITATQTAQTIVDTTSSAVTVIEQGTPVVIVTGPQGPAGPLGPQGTAGLNAAVITDIAVDASGDLITVLDNGQQFNAGSVNLSLGIGSVTQGSVVGATITGSGLATNLNLVLPNADALGLGAVTNESKATMFANPTFTGTVTGVTAAMVGLGAVTNESKSTMFDSAALTGVPTAPTAGSGTNTTQIATTAFVRTEVSNLVNSAPGALDTLDELAAALGDDASFAANVTAAIGLKAPIDSPTFTGTVSGITKTMVGLGNVLNETKATAFTSPSFTGTAGAVNLTVSGLLTVTESTEILEVKTAVSGTVIHDFTLSNIWYYSSITGAVTANITNVPTTNNRVISISIVVNQGGTGYLVNGIEIDSAVQSIKWQNNITPTASINKVDVFTFNLVRTGSTWTVLGAATSHG